MDESEIINGLYNPNLLPFLFFNPDKNDTQISSKNLQISDFYIQYYRNKTRAKTIEDTHDVLKLNESLTRIFEGSNDLLKIRAILLLIMLKNFIKMAPTFEFLINEDLNVAQLAQNDSICLNPGKYFNETFFDQIKMHKLLMTDFVEIIKESVKRSSLQYSSFYAIMNMIITASENSMTPVDFNKLIFMDEIDLNDKYKNQIIQSFPIVLPFQLKYADYLHQNIDCPTVYIKVERRNVLDAVWFLDTFRDCNIKLKADFINEGGIDAGGLTREFIYLAFTTLIKPEVGLFENRNGFIWFKYHKELTDELKKKYRCFGILLGIAVLNRLTIPIHFPRYFYKKLLHKDIFPSELVFYDPDLVLSINNIFPLDITENDDLDFVYVDSVNGFEIDLTDFTLIEDPDNHHYTKLTNSNKGDYMIRVAEWVFDISVTESFNAFEEGYHRISTNKMLYSYFRCDEIDRIISGNPIIEWNALKAKAIYKNGYSSNSQAIIWFWDYFDKLSEDKKFEALKFITGTTSIPPGGLSDVRISITKRSNGFPIAHTCFSEIELPDYNSYEELVNKCTEAFANSEFGMS